MIRSKLQTGEMAGDAGHCDFTVAPRRPEVEGEDIVLDVLGSRVVLSRH